MDREYVYRMKNGRWSKSTKLPKHMAAARKRIGDLDPFTVTQDGDPISRRVKRATALDRYQTAVENRELGSDIRIRNRKADVVFAGRAVKDAPDAVDTNGNHNADEFWTWVLNTYPQYKPRFAGSYVCKTIIGSGGVRSQHSYGNAVDIFFSSIAQQESVFRDVTNGKAPVRVAHAISLSRIWEPGVGIHTYTGERHYHLHTDYLPQYSGACGVRG